jgi:hypothetical protein
VTEGIGGGVEESGLVPGMLVAGVRVSTACVGESVGDGEVGSRGDSSIRVAVDDGRVGQSSLVSIAVVIVEVGDPRGVFDRGVSNRVRCLRMPVGGVVLGAASFRGLWIFGIMGECRRSARGKKNDFGQETEGHGGKYQNHRREFSSLSWSDRK